jgi:regulator of replication initiation timing
MTDVDFINAYVAKLKAMVDELLNKNIILDTRLSLLEPKLTEYQAEIDDLKQKATVKEKKEKKTEENSF